jgi:peptidyl-prolyl cis-trans isomerase B (cyclophilin B)
MTEKEKRRISAKQMREQLERERLEKEKRQNRIILLSTLGILAAILITVGVIWGVNLYREKHPFMDPTSPDYTVSTEPTNFVKLTVQYRDGNNKYRQGEIIVELRPDIAPITVANFQKLVSEGFYNGLTFHRIVPGFMIQGGDPEGTGMGGSPNKIKGEFSSNGFANPLLHERGVISMARSNDKNSASSQFFIMHDDNENLDGNYAAFGKVVFGMDTVDGIASTKCEQDGQENSTPVTPPVIVSAVFVTPVAK